MGSGQPVGQTHGYWRSLYCVSWAPVRVNNKSIFGRNAREVKMVSVWQRRWFRRQGLVWCAILLSLYISPVVAFADDDTKPPYSPGVGRTLATNLYWGDTHVHTINSLDAGVLGTTLGPSEAYRFAKGQEMVSNTGLPARLRRPLDFFSGGRPF